ncbi:MAG: membrane dipeptidase, partial [Planctomycetota bacterium]
MIIFDAHLDLAWNALDWNRDLRTSCATIRQVEIDAGMQDKGRQCNTVALPDLRRGKVGIVIATLLPRLLRIGAMPAIQRYSSMAAAYGAAYGQLYYYRGLEQEGHMRRIDNAGQLNAHLKAWQADEDSKTLPIGYILSMEGADPVLRPDQVQEWFDAGLRIIGPAHYGVSPYAHGTGTEGGLFSQGPALLKEMQRVGMILDITHLSDQCFDEALDIYGGPVLASHHNNRTLVPN